MSSMSILLSLCFALLVSHVTGAAIQTNNDYDLPTDVKICKRDDSDYNSCITNSVQESWMTFVQGISRLDVPVLDPLAVNMIEDRIGTKYFYGYASISDVRIYGLANTKFLSVRPQFTEDRIRLEMDVEIPKVLIEGDYKTDGAVGPFHIGGTGDFNVSMAGLTATWTLDGHIENDRWIVEHFVVDPEVQHVKIYFSDLFDGDLILTKAAMAISNRYWPVMFKAVIPIVQKLSDRPLTDFVNNSVFSKLPVSKIFP